MSLDPTPPPLHLRTVRADDEARGCTAALDAAHHPHAAPCGYIPQPDAAVRRGRGDVVAVGVPSHQVDIRLMAYRGKGEGIRPEGPRQGIR